MDNVFHAKSSTELVETFVSASNDYMAGNKERSFKPMIGSLSELCQSCDYDRSSLEQAVVFAGPALKALTVGLQRPEDITDFLGLSFCLGVFAVIAGKADEAKVEIPKDLRCPRTLRLVRSQSKSRCLAAFARWCAPSPEEVKYLSNETLRKKRSTLLVVEGAAPHEGELALMTDYSVGAGILNLWLEKRQLIPRREAFTWDDALSFGFAFHFVVADTATSMLLDIQESAILKERNSCDRTFGQHEA